MSEIVFFLECLFIVGRSFISICLGSMSTEMLYVSGSQNRMMVKFEGSVN